jgi:hypothetical protein
MYTFCLVQEWDSDVDVEDMSTIISNCPTLYDIVLQRNPRLVIMNGCNNYGTLHGTLHLLHMLRRLC